jgi:hypothetical protein
MAITRTPIHDDDGSGTTGTIIDNAWKQELYNQIDAGLAPVSAAPVYGTWTPIDGSGATLTFNVLGGRYCKIDKQVTIWCDLVYPVTADTRDAVIAGLPFANAGPNIAGFTLGYGPQILIFLGNTLTYVALVSASTLATTKNNTLSGARLMFQGSYLTT